MAAPNLFSVRQSRLKGGVPQFVVYDPIPAVFRAQIIHIWNDAFGTNSQHFPMNRKAIFADLRNTLCREYGKFSLSEGGGDEETDLLTFFSSAVCNTDQALDIVELSFRAILETAHNAPYRFYANPRISPQEAVDELNHRFREHALGYQFENCQVIRLDSSYSHEEIVKPVLVLLGDPVFRGPEDEFRRAHDHHRHGRSKEAINEALKAFESTMKVIATQRNWALSGIETAKGLIKICGVNGLFPAYLESHYNALRSTLESGVPVLRNKTSGHGQGVQVQPVDAFFTIYVLNLTGAAIRFLAEAHAHLK